jgi:hypothetical protein
VTADIRAVLVASGDAAALAAWDELVVRIENALEDDGGRIAGGYYPTTRACCDTRASGQHDQDCWVPSLPTALRNAGALAPSPNTGY